MKALALPVIVALLVSTALPSLVHAEASSCMATAGDKKLAGAAKASFLNKCEADAKATCNATAANKKLAGAAKVSFTKKCVSDAVGS